MYIMSRINEILNKDSYDDKKERVTYTEEVSMIKVIMSSCDIPEHYYKMILFHKNRIDNLYSCQRLAWKEYNILVAVLYVCHEYSDKDARLDVSNVYTYIDNSFKHTKTVKDAIRKMYIIYRNESMRENVFENDDELI